MSMVPTSMVPTTNGSAALRVDLPTRRTVCDERLAVNSLQARAVTLSSGRSSVRIFQATARRKSQLF